MKKLLISLAVAMATAVTTVTAIDTNVTLVKSIANSNCVQAVHFTNPLNTYAGSIGATNNIGQILANGNNMAGQNMTNGQIEGMSTVGLTNGVTGNIKQNGSVPFTGDQSHGTNAITQIKNIDALRDSNPLVGLHSMGSPGVTVEAFGAGQYGHKGRNPANVEEPYVRIGDYAYGSQQRGVFYGTNTIDDGSYGCEQSGYFGHNWAIAFMRGYGSKQLGFLGLYDSTVTNLGYGSIGLFNISSGTPRHQLITAGGHASVALGAVVVSNSECIVAGDGNQSHGNGSITANSLWANDLHVAGSSIYFGTSKVFSFDGSNLISQVVIVFSNDVSGVQAAYVTNPVVNGITALDTNIWDYAGKFAATGGVVNGDLHINGDVYLVSLYATNVYVTNVWTVITNLQVVGNGRVTGNFSVDRTNTALYFYGNATGLSNNPTWDAASDFIEANSNSIKCIGNTLYVDNKRVDSYIADGSILRPFTNIQEAINAITSPSSGNKWTIQISPGAAYADPITVDKIYTTFQGGGFNGSRISGKITINTPSLAQITFEHLRISGGLECLVSHIAINVLDCDVTTSSWVMAPITPTADEYLQVFGGLWQSDVSLTNISVYLMGGGYYSTWTASNGEFNVNNADINDPFQVTLSGTLTGSAYGDRAGNSKFILNSGVTMNMDADTEGGSVITVNSGATLNRTTKASNIKNDSIAAGTTVKDVLAVVAESNNWRLAYGWGNHGTNGYVTNPVAGRITVTDTSAWQNAYDWLTTYSGSLASTTYVLNAVSPSNNWNTAYTAIAGSSQMWNTVYLDSVAIPTNAIWNIDWRMPYDETKTCVWAWAKTDFSTCTVDIVTMNPTNNWNLGPWTTNMTIVAITTGSQIVGYGPIIPNGTAIGFKTRENNVSCSNVTIRLKLR